MALPEFINIFKRVKIYVEKKRSNYLIKASGKRKWGEIENEDKELLKQTKDINKKLIQLLDDIEQQLN